MILPAIGFTFSARELARERRDRRAAFAQPFVERAHDTVRIGAPQCESGALRARCRHEHRVDLARTPSFVDREREDDAARLAHAQDAVDERAVEVGRDAGKAAIGQHDVDADDLRARLRGGGEERPQVPMPQRHRLGERRDRGLVNADDDDAVGGCRRGGIAKEREARIGEPPLQRRGEVQPADDDTCGDRGDETRPGEACQDPRIARVHAPPRTRRTLGGSCVVESRAVSALMLALGGHAARRV